MKRPKRSIVIKLWPSGLPWGWVFIVILVVLCAGKPDIIDAVVHRIMDCPKQVETE